MSLLIWDRRIRRANDLASEYPFAVEGLRFYKAVAEFQKSFYGEIRAACGTQIENRAPGSLRDEFDVFVLLPRFSPFLSLIGKIAPAPLAEAARELTAQNAAAHQDLLARFWQADSRSSTQLAPGEFVLAWTYLQPYAEYLASHSRALSPDGAPPRCPLCNSNPIAGVLRPEGEGAKRSLICMLCGHEWLFRRIFCPACGEESEPKLAVYIAPEFKHVRVEVCESCRMYIKSVDLTKNGLADPVVDELATIPLNLWAQEHGFTKLQPNLLGI